MKSILVSAAAILSVTLATLFQGWVHAATFGPIADGDVPELIDAIEAANANGKSDTIILATNGTYSLSPTADARIPLAFGTEGLPRITSVITIQGNGSVIERDSSLFIGTDRCNATSDSPNFRVIWILSGALTLEDVTIQNGCAVGDAFGGGGIRNNGETNLVRSTVPDNAAIDFSGGGQLGGGIFNSGSGRLTLTQSTVRGNSAFDGFGGGIYASGSGGIILTDSTLVTTRLVTEGAAFMGPIL